MSGSIASANATFCATLVDQWVTEGMTAAFIAPGSRSTPLALALAEHPGLRIEVFHDERSASFAALGHGLITGTPAAVVCTSGTAAAHFHAAVIEADLSAVPVLICTADRPPELWGRGAPQTIDQTNIYGASVRGFVEPGPPDDGDPASWRSLARNAWRQTLGATPGPVHLNLSFREPLTGTADPLPPPLPTEAASAPRTADEGLIADLVGRLHGRRGVIIAGRGETDPPSVLRLAARLAWPVIADHRSGCRSYGHECVIDHFDSLLRHGPFADDHRPDVVLRLGEIVSSKAVSMWLRSLEADMLTGRPHGRHIDPEALSDLSFDEAGVINDVDAATADVGRDAAAPIEWLTSWRMADDAAGDTIADVLADTDEANEIAIARRVLRSAGSNPTDGCLVLASSMPVRDVEWFGNRSGATVLSNRGANGIDGTIATAIGVAATGVATTVLIGDIAFLHDSTSLVALARRNLDLTIVVVDNDGGGIFSFLPQRSLLDTQRYEQLFGTSHGTDLAGLTRAHGLAVEPLTDATRLEPAGVRVIVATTDRARNLTLHDAVHAAVAAAYDRGQRDD